MKFYKITKQLMLLISILLLLISSIGCTPKETADHGKIKLVATTTMLADLAKTIGGSEVEVTGLMPHGVDPHSYKASAGDVKRMQDADIVVYNGLNLEGKLGEVFSQLKLSNKTVVEIAKGLPVNRLIKESQKGVYDPHIWFDVALWKEAAASLVEGLSKVEPSKRSFFVEKYTLYQKELDLLDAFIKAQVDRIPQNSRVLITAHDAFSYFGKAYGFEVRGLQGISTVSEASTQQIKALADFIVNRNIKAIFVESSVSRKSIEALQEAVRARGFDIKIGGTLYSDSLGNPGSAEENYIGTVRANIETIVKGLK